MTVSMAVTVAVTSGPPPRLVLRGRLGPEALADALALVQPCAAGPHRHDVSHGAVAPHVPVLRRYTAGHHTLTLPPPPYAPGPLAELVAHAEQGPVPLPSCCPEPDGFEAMVPWPAGPGQQDVLVEAMAHPEAALHVEQMHWRWRGPLERGRFMDAWQQLYAGEAALRSALAEPRLGEPAPLVVVHPQASPLVQWHARGEGNWHALLLAERQQPFDLHRPGGGLRITLLQEQRECTRILLTYHRSLLDGWSVRLLQRALYRAYLAGGRSTGGERRPDIRDHGRWLAAQDGAAARAFWVARARSAAGVAALPGRVKASPALPAPLLGRGSRGRTRQCLSLQQARGLRDWAVERGVSESTVLHAVWAIQLQRAAVHSASSESFVLDTVPTPVVFAASASGRGIALAGAEQLPGPLETQLPVHVTVSAAMPVTDLLSDLADHALDASAYEWVSPGQFRRWAGHGGGPLPESLITFVASQPGGVQDRVLGELALEGVHVEQAETIEAHTALAYSITAHQDGAGALVLSAVYDRTRISDVDGAEMLAQTVRLLCALPAMVDESVTVGDVAQSLAGAPVPRIGPGARGVWPAAGRLRVLRGVGRHDAFVRGRRSFTPRAVQPVGPELPAAGTICLIPPAGAPPGCYDELAGVDFGALALVTVSPTANVESCLMALRPVVAGAEPLILAGLPASVALAREVADRIAAHGWRPPLIVIGGDAPSCPASVQALARTLKTAVAALGPCRFVHPCKGPVRPPSTCHQE
ncbi:condensation domain-containing protein [Streptomyces sp. NPDC058872]|uniref:condensation domain-containing protein n=1 Tax=Streptomyces sp. NPDC058872 TaxID=3346661 RepID=UPI0036B92C3B